MTKRIRHTWMVILAAWLSGCGSKEEPPPKPIVEVTVAKAEMADVQLSVRAPATIFPKEQANLSARVSAPIRSLHTRKGDTVTAGQLVAELENSDIAAQRDEATAAVADAEANLQKVTSGTAPTDIERARGQLESARAALGQAQKFYERRQELFRQGAIPNRDLLMSQTELAQAKTAYDVAKRSLDLLQQQSTEKDIKIAQSRVDQAQARLKLIKAQLAFTEIRSPFAGSITEQLMYPGDMAKPDAPIVTLVDLSVAVARVQVPEVDAAGIRKHQRCVFTSIDDPESPWEGRVSVVNQAVDSTRRTVEVWCDLSNSRRILRAGAFGSVLIEIGIQAKSVIVPQPAVQFSVGGTKAAVVVITDQQTSLKKGVEAGAIFDGKVQIKKGIQPAETVIVSGGYGLPDGTAVKVVKENK
ncbi:MAG: efflux RND transporter periplasmic adaptor subunit [Acidobacteria bacterium]|nr:efflux RND transporter periplasmic adaptor subunit [Acidobacteriota bacterium]